MSRDSGVRVSVGVLPMNAQNAHLIRPRLRCVGAAIVIGLIAALVVNSLPVFLTVLAQARGLSESQSGLIAFAEMGGIAVGTTFCALTPRLLQRLTWRWVAAIGLLTLCVANVLAVFVTLLPALLIILATAGIGSGVAMAVTYAVLAQGDSARDLAIFNVAQLASGWLAIPLLDPIATQFGVGRLFGIMATLAFVAVALCAALPRGADTGPTMSPAHQKVSKAGWLAIASVLLYFSGAGAIYAYLAFMGVAWGGQPKAVEAGLSIIMFAAMMGGVTVAIIGSRFGGRLPMYAAYLVLLISILLLALLQPVDEFVLLGCVFGFAWNVVTPYQFEAVTFIDDSSSAAMLVNAGTLGGLAIGPAIAGFLATPDYQRVNVLAFGSCTLSLLLLVVVLRMRGNRTLMESHIAEEHHA
jgi:MFS family permease